MRRLLIAAGVALLTACATDPPPPDRFYTLKLDQPAVAGDWKGRIVVQPFEAHGIYSDRPLLFRRSAAESTAVEQFNYHFWAEPPAMLLGDLLADHLRQVLGEQNVFRAMSRVRPDLVVRPRLRSLEQVLEPAPAQARLRLQFVVTDDLNTPLLVVDFEESEKLASIAPEDYVAAVNRMAERACAEFAQKLVALRR